MYKLSTFYVLHVWMCCKIGFMASFPLLLKRFADLGKIIDPWYPFQLSNCFENLHRKKQCQNSLKLEIIVQLRNKVWTNKFSLDWNFYRVLEGHQTLQQHLDFILTFPLWFYAHYCVKLSHVIKALAHIVPLARPCPRYQRALSI